MLKFEEKKQVLDLESKQLYLLIMSTEASDDKALCKSQCGSREVSLHWLMLQYQLEVVYLEEMTIG